MFFCPLLLGEIVVLVFIYNALKKYEQLLAIKINDKDIFSQFRKTLCHQETRRDQASKYRRDLLF